VIGFHSLYCTVSPGKEMELSRLMGNMPRAGDKADQHVLVPAISICVFLEHAKLLITRLLFWVFNYLVLG